MTHRALESVQRAGPPPEETRPAKVIERIDEATQELDSGVGQASAAAAQLQRAIDQISREGAGPAFRS
jgi:methyl-accepting chemotaxis protein